MLALATLLFVTLLVRDLGENSLSRVAVLPLTYKNVPASDAEVITETLLVELRNLLGNEPVGSKDIHALSGLEAALSAVETTK